MKKLFLIIMVFFLFVSCTKEEQKELKISVNPWIGYAPIFYAYEKGYLKDLNIKVIPTVSLGESMDMFNLKKTDMLSGTQHEFNSLKKNSSTLTPIILMDRSNGGDMILSNKTIEDLQKSKTIKVYLEIDSINNEMIRSFIKNYKLDSTKITFINKDQSQLQGYKFNIENDIIIVTYTPYDLKFKRDGFNEIASTKNINELLVIDAIYTTKKVIIKNKERFKKFKLAIDKSINQIKKDPTEAHKRIAKYLDNISLKEFKDSLTVIKWVNNPSDKLLIELKEIGYLKENLI